MNNLSFYYLLCQQCTNYFHSTFHSTLLLLVIMPTTLKTTFIPPTRTIHNSKTYFFHLLCMQPTNYFFPSGSPLATISKGERKMKIASLQVAVSKITNQTTKHTNHHAFHLQYATSSQTTFFPLTTFATYQHISFHLLNT